MVNRYLFDRSFTILFKGESPNLSSLEILWISAVNIHLPNIGIDSIICNMRSNIFYNFVFAEINTNYTHNLTVYGRHEWDIGLYLVVSEFD